ncbi:hypothetical protein BUALT_Bualt18G0041600 [Buddleja alternifolia]|uniref:Uncharacterized protein n=1 Tax=Buddleja alternifolia TaxID=168488 RepID=A0AAV6W8S2_9LAMI|nr:hypothetical protein BUALT_Bualt18G0041600 [Buddleja alternifolia]
MPRVQREERERERKKERDDTSTGWPSGSREARSAALLRRSRSKATSLNGTLAPCWICYGNAYADQEEMRSSNCSYLHTAHPYSKTEMLSELTDGQKLIYQKSPYPKGLRRVGAWGLCWVEEGYQYKPING